LKKWDEDLDLDEVECMLANLIYMGLIKGYISHEQSLMVLAREDPFPLKR
jgi:PCI domain